MTSTCAIFPALSVRVDWSLPRTHDDAIMFAAEAPAAPGPGHTAIPLDTARWYGRGMAENPVRSITCARPYRHTAPRARVIMRARACVRTCERLSLSLVWRYGLIYLSEIAGKKAIPLPIPLPKATDMAVWLALPVRASFWASHWKGSEKGVFAHG